MPGERGAAIRTQDGAGREAAPPNSLAGTDAKDGATEGVQAPWLDSGSSCDSRHRHAARGSKRRKADEPSLLDPDIDMSDGVTGRTWTD